MAFSLFLGNQN